MTRLSVGEALIKLLERKDVDTIFGIPGIHTIELYRGLDGSPMRHGRAIRHVTPRHEQGAAFMADGYARVTGKPGVCLLITGPGFTNALTAIAQARADSIPMLIISGINACESLGKQLGHLHELPDQSALSRTVCLETHTLLEPDRLGEVVDKAFAAMTRARPGPVHIEIPTDVMAMTVGLSDSTPSTAASASQDAGKANIERAAAFCQSASAPIILAGGGVRDSVAVQRLATSLDAPVVSTVNARGLMAGHALNVPASATLTSVRRFIDESDLVLALGTELGPTDYDMYDTGTMPALASLIRVDIEAAQFTRRDDPGLMIEADAATFASSLADELTPAERRGAARAEQAKQAALEEIGPAYRAHVDLLHEIWWHRPDAIMVGDSTQLVYAGNMFIEPPGPGVWFNSATGFGTLGYAAPAAIGASLGRPDQPVICLIGDGGLQFTLAEIGSALDCGADVVFLVWNNRGYQEIETSMIAADVQPLGVRPSAPDFVKIAEAYGLSAERVDDLDQLGGIVGRSTGPCLIEYICP
ncbi:MAG: 5-guanidino-2-oxopentanoate decarboxylase [Pseudomonadota bacterium]